MDSKGAESNRPTVFEGFRDEKWEVLLLLVRIFYRHVAFEQDYFCINKEEKEKGLIDFVVLETIIIIEEKNVAPTKRTRDGDVVVIKSTIPTVVRM